MEIEVIVAIIGFGITLLTFVWRTAVLTTKIHKNEESIKAAHARVDKYVEKHNANVEKHNANVEELRAQIHVILQSQARIEEKISFLVKDLEKKRN